MRSVKELYIKGDPVLKLSGHAPPIGRLIWLMDMLGGGCEGRVCHKAFHVMYRYAGVLQLMVREGCGTKSEGAGYAL